MPKRRKRRPLTTISTQTDEFIGIKRSQDRCTVWIEGRDQDGVSVSGTSMSVETIDLVIKRLTNVKTAIIGQRKADNKRNPKR